MLKLISALNRIIPYLPMMIASSIVLMFDDFPHNNLSVFKLLYLYLKLSVLCSHLKYSNLERSKLASDEVYLGNEGIIFCLRDEKALQTSH